MSLKIDIFTHILTQRYTEKYIEYNPSIKDRVEYRATPVWNLPVREGLMKRRPDVLQVLTMANIPLEKFAPDHSAELARIGNEELAELLVKRQDLFCGAAAVLPMNDVDASLKEIDHAIKVLRLDGIQVYTRVVDEWLASEKYHPILARMAELDKPIWIHPDFPGDFNKEHKDWDFGLFTWPFETTNCMLRLVESGIFREYPNIKFVVHHAGAMVPYFAERVKGVIRNSRSYYPGIDEDFKKFYVDTALYGNTSGLMCAYDYYGADHILFGTDAPLGDKSGERTILSIERMAIPQGEKDKIFSLNAQELLQNVV